MYTNFSHQKNRNTEILRLKGVAGVIRKKDRNCQTDEDNAIFKIYFQLAQQRWMSFGGLPGS